MKITKAVKVRLYPTTSQKEEIEKYFGYARFTYNSFLELWQVMYHNHKKGEDPVNEKNVIKEYRRIINLLSKKVDDYAWIKEYSKQIIETAGEDVSRGWDNFFNPKMTNNRPKFKSKKKQKNVFRFHKKGYTDVTLSFGFKDSNHLWMQKIFPRESAGIRFKRQKVTDCIEDLDIKTITIEKKAGRYFASIVYGSEINSQPDKNGSYIGIDLGLTDFAILSNGDKYNNPYFKRLKHYLNEYKYISVYFLEKNIHLIGIKQREPSYKKLI